MKNIIQKIISFKTGILFIKYLNSRTKKQYNKLSEYLTSDINISYRVLLNAIKSNCDVLEILIQRELFNKEVVVLESYFASVVYYAAKAGIRQLMIFMQLSDIKDKVPFIVSRQSLLYTKKLCNDSTIHSFRYLVNMQIISMTPLYIFDNAIYLSIDKLRIVFDTPAGRNILYNKKRFKTQMQEFNQHIFTLSWVDYKNTDHVKIELIMNQIRIERTECNRRALFWGAILTVRMRDFLRRYYAPGGKGYHAAKRDFVYLKYARVNSV